MQAVEFVCEPIQRRRRSRQFPLPTHQFQSARRFCIRRCRWLWLLPCVLWLRPALPGHATCGEALEDTRRALAAEELALHTTEQAVRTARDTELRREAALREALAHPPARYDPALAQRLGHLRRMEVAPKWEILEGLRAQHETARQQWERGHRLLDAQLVQARTAFESHTLSPAEYCQVREAYQHALSLYLQGIERYRAGMEFYARAVAAYGERFLVPYTQGFTDPPQWEELIRRLERGDFLHDLLVPMTANAIRSLPPEVPP